jgi:PAS domain S-box-containing protein
MQDGLLVVDTNGKILAINPAFETMTGYTSSELVNKSCTILNCTGCEIYGRGSGRQWCALFAKGEVRHRKCEIAAKDGRTVHIVKHATVLRNEKDQVTGAVETLMDISQQVRQEEEILSLRCSLSRQSGNYGIVGSSQPIQQLLDLIENVAKSDAPVLIYGESGVGKELVARAIHELGMCTGGNFMKVNCASLNENLLESELFGHVKGAFTGANQSRIGRFEAACGGSIFLDEIGDISPTIQIKLLRVLENKEIERVGDHRPIPVDARFITATNKNLDMLVAQGLFREDLYYRINVVPIYVLPLRKRKEDIPVLAQTFIDKIAARSGKSIVGLTTEALEILCAYHWPGNVRELRNTIEYAFVLCHESLITPQHLPQRITSSDAVDQLGGFSVLSNWKNDYLESARQGEQERLIEVLKKTGGNQTETARVLGVSRVTIWKKMKKYGIQLKKDLR